MSNKPFNKKLRESVFVLKPFLKTKKRVLSESIGNTLKIIIFKGFNKLLI